MTAALLSRRVLLAAAVALAAAAPAAAQLSVVEIRIAPGGVFVIASESVTRDGLRERLRAIAALTPQPAISVAPDLKSKYGDVMHLLQEAEAAGIKSIGVIGGT